MTDVGTGGQIDAAEYLSLSDNFGVGITGVDLSKELDEKLFEEIVISS